MIVCKRDLFLGFQYGNCMEFRKDQVVLNRMRYRFIGFYWAWFDFVWLLGGVEKII